MGLGKDLFSKGMFLKELPPCFESELVGKHYPNLLKICKRKKSKETICKLISYNIPNNQSRRKMAIPHPIPYILLCEILQASKTEIDKKMTDVGNHTSFSLPERAPHRALKYSKKYHDFVLAITCGGIGKKYLVKVDISKFYSSIYTHSIPRVLHGKDESKKRRNDVKLKGNKIDIAIRHCQENQSIGIPIGPDTSILIGELLAGHFGNKLVKEFNDIEVFRFVDDYYIYVDSYEEGLHIVNGVISILQDYELGLNDEKTKIMESLAFLDDTRVYQLSSFKISDSVAQKKQLVNFFSLAFSLASKYNDSSIVKFALKTLTFHKIREDSWEVVQKILLKTLLNYPVYASIVMSILISYSNKSYKLNLDDLHNVCNSLIKNNLPLGNTHEIVWGLRIALQLNIRIDDITAESLFQSNDILGKILGLDLIKKGIINKFKFKKQKNLETFLNESDLLDENWLLRYEAYINDWIKIDGKKLKTNPFFKYLIDNKLSFYNPNKQIDTFNIDDLEEKVKTKTTTIISSYD